MKVFKKNFYIGPVANAMDDPDQLVAMIGAAMSGLPEADREYVNRLLEDIRVMGYGPDTVNELMALRNGLIHNPGIIDMVTHGNRATHSDITLTDGTILELKMVSQRRRRTIIQGLNNRPHPNLTDAQETDANILEPPEMAEKLLFMLPKHMRDPILGDLEEDFPKVCQKFGTQYAKKWYWQQVLTSIGFSIIKRLIKVCWRWGSGS